MSERLTFPPDRERDEPRNLAALALHGVVIRIAWIFKTESVIMPAFLDSLGGAGWLRGLLPVLNRLGQSLPAFALADRLQAAPVKKRALQIATLGQSLPFLVLAGLLISSGASTTWGVPVFLVLYTIFFAFTGLNQIATGTLSGKLVRPFRRGRLLAMSTFGGTLPAAALAWWLLPGWLEGPGGADYASIFLFCGLVFLVASVVALAPREAPDSERPSIGGVRRKLAEGRRILREDASYRRLVVVATLFSTAIMVFPHYQALARERLALAGASLMVWTVTQNLSIGFASLVAGPLADRYGNRLALRFVIFGSAVVPGFAVLLTWLPRELARDLFPLVFVGIGLTPIGLRLLSNYTLELSPESEHPRYLSLLQLCVAAAFIVSPVLGLLVDFAGFEVVFLGQSALLVVGGALTFRLHEPRA